MNFQRDMTEALPEESHGVTLPRSMSLCMQAKKCEGHQPKQPNLKGRESYERMNFLIQGAMTTLAQTPHNIDMVRHYMKSLHGIKSKKVLRWSQDVKHAYCRGCHMLLVPGITTRVRIKANRRIVSTCLLCNNIKRNNITNPIKRKRKKRRKKKEE
ncbi:ribonuclease P protein subunit p21 isoform X1 [Hydra vulgaris]|uniref:ribonuclease P protein subunit p21 isoform X1 n=1 Tax=Hydra vulgaris TaxID=6087 RepID=UPI001F5F9638|nr:ribonuclease P protein subunit p21 isoform X1 [Hydra vulgaris]